MKPTEALEKGKQLMAALGKDMRTASGYKIELKGLDVSDNLCTQLDEVCCKLEGSFSKLQGLIKAKKNKDDDYTEVIKEVLQARTEFGDRAGYAKAIIQANGMKARAAPKAAAKAAA